MVCYLEWKSTLLMRGEIVCQGLVTHTKKSFIINKTRKGFLFIINREMVHWSIKNETRMPKGLVFHCHWNNNFGTLVSEWPINFTMKLEINVYCLGIECLRSISIDQQNI